MADETPDDRAGCGRLSGGPETTLTERTVEFVRGELPGWRDDPHRPAEESEERLNGQLCKFLNVAAAYRFPMVHFHHEEKQTAGRRVDISANPLSARFVGETFHTIYHPFIVFEGKRLPAPSKDREREYLTGGEAKSGGIQRFRLGLHGAEQRQVAIIGYVQRGTTRECFGRINRWVAEIQEALALDGLAWCEKDVLTEFRESVKERTAFCRSKHRRSGAVVSDEVLISHLWIQMDRH